MHGTRAISPEARYDLAHRSDQPCGGAGMTREDEIMAGYLLKGGKMLSTSCPSCGCPLFEVKGKTLCVVCAERQGEKGSRAPGKSDQTQVEPGTQQHLSKGDDASPLEKTLEETLIGLCERIRNEKDPRCVSALMEALTLGIEGLSALRSR